MSGTKARPMRVTLIDWTVSVTTQNCETSAPGACSRGDHQQGGDRVGELVDPGEVQDRASVAAQDRDPLAGVDTGPTTDGDDDVAAGFGVLLETGRDLMILGVGRDTVPERRHQARLTQMAEQLINPPGGQQPRVGDHERAASAQTLRGETRLS